MTFEEVYHDLEREQNRKIVADWKKSEYYPKDGEYSGVSWECVFERTFEDYDSTDDAVQVAFFWMTSDMVSNIMNNEQEIDEMWEQSREYKELEKHIPYTGHDFNRYYSRFRERVEDMFLSDLQEGEKEDEYRDVAGKFVDFCENQMRIIAAVEYGEEIDGVPLPPTEEELREKEKTDKLCVLARYLVNYEKRWRNAIKRFPEEGRKHIKGGYVGKNSWEGKLLKAREKLSKEKIESLCDIYLGKFKWRNLDELYTDFYLPIREMI